MKIFTVLSLLTLASCSSLLNYTKKKDEFKNVEFDKKVVIVETEEPKAVSSTATANPLLTAAPPAVADSAAKPVTKAVTKKKKKSVREVSKSAAVLTHRQPEIEDAEGFENFSRRPPVDPFRVGEQVIHDVTYLGASAGTLALKVNHFAMVNGKKSYNFVVDLKSNSFFSRVFAVDDKVQTFVDFESLTPHVFKLDIRDSGQVKEAQAYFDNDNLKADYWEHRYTEKGGHEEKKLSWSILPYSQNPFSAIFYMRIFKFSVGKEYTFRVADDEKNVSFKAKAIEKTLIKTDAGQFPAIKLKAEVYSRGNLAKASDFYIWISDDDRKYILRIEVKLPFGSIVSEAVEIKEGKAP